MESRRPSAGGFTLLDGTALVTGGAVASVHIRSALPSASPGPGWVLVWIAFTGVALTAAGPFVFLERRFGRRTGQYPRVGDWLWGMWGLPWLLTALVRTAATGSSQRSAAELVALGLHLGLGLATLVALGVVWRTWVFGPPGPEPVRGEGSSWTNRMGLILSVAWPLQYGFTFFVTESPR